MIHHTVKRRFCDMDGTREGYNVTGECVECHLYARAVKRGKIEGIDGRTEKQKRESNHVNS